MDFFVATAQAQHSCRALRTKEELFDYLSKMIDESIEKDCLYFDLIVNAVPKKKEE
jgi:hypothetical protein